MIARGRSRAFRAVAAFRDGALGVLEKHIGRSSAKPKEAAVDEDFWRGIRDAFDIDTSIINFNNGGCSPSPRVVQECLARQQKFANTAPSYHMWKTLDPEIEGVRSRLAKMFGCDPEELAITRNASESLQTCIFGLPLGPGDEIIATVYDYPRMLNTFRQLERREGVKVVKVDVSPTPASKQELVDAYANAITTKTRMILVQHVAFMNGQIYPVKEICELGKSEPPRPDEWRGEGAGGEGYSDSPLHFRDGSCPQMGRGQGEGKLRDIPVIVDGAHAFGQIPFKNLPTPGSFLTDPSPRTGIAERGGEAIGCDYYGTSLHKWLMAPVGTGFLYVKRDKIRDLWPLMAAADAQDDDIRKFEEIGTHQAAVHNAIDEAITFHEMIGPERKAARLLYLRSRWTSKLEGIPGVRFLTNLSDEDSCAITTVAIDGVDPQELSKWLEEEHRIITAPIPELGGIRITPTVYSTVAEVDRFAGIMADRAIRTN